MDTAPTNDPIDRALSRLAELTEHGRGASASALMSWLTVLHHAHGRSDEALAAIAATEIARHPKANAALISSALTRIRSPG